MAEIPRSSDIHRVIPMMLRRYRNLTARLKTVTPSILARKTHWESIAKKGGQWGLLNPLERSYVIEALDEQEAGPADSERW